MSTACFFHGFIWCRVFILKPTKKLKIENTKIVIFNHSYSNIDIEYHSQFIYPTSY